MRWILIILTSFICISCSHVKNYENVHKDFIPTVKRFEKEAAKRGYHVDLSNAHIQYGSMIPLWGGYCNAWSRKIFVNPMMKGSPRSYLDTVIIHELGHCAFGMHHRRTDGASLMSPRPDRIFWIDPWNKDYLDEFFSEEHFDEL